MSREEFYFKAGRIGIVLGLTMIVVSMVLYRISEEINHNPSLANKVNRMINPRILYGLNNLTKLTFLTPVLGSTLMILGFLMMSTLSTLKGLSVFAIVFFGLSVITFMARTEEKFLRLALQNPNKSVWQNFKYHKPYQLVLILFLFILCSIVFKWAFLHLM